ncbi:glutathione S-transferase [Cognatiyoonia koreensis]|uniref:Glutathione S-transferase n=1 Tax=Cognatiyoonia koreensis TaxID=364200 RepID=A0A1I0MJ11_9RHOB|nr:glutathione S-transferase family protein [Cognatiyoonia koreensis]SEV88289.1 glutathione S-transferase [Cognatiyoonia koreensis]
MLKFYYSKGSSALAAHILLLEVAADFAAIEVPIGQGSHQQADFLARNPKGRIPVLETPDGVITENPAILEYIAATHPASATLPNGIFAQSEARSLCAYLCATVHVAFAHLKRAPRWADTIAAQDDMRQVAPRNLAACAAYLDQCLRLGPWAMGSSYTYCDPYLFLIGHWLAAADVSLAPYERLVAHRDAMLARPATQAAMAAHDLD